MPASIPPNAVATLAHLGVKSAHRPHAAAVRELACAALSMLRSATAHTPSLHRVLLVGALGDDRVCWACQGGALREAPNRSAADGPPGALCTLAVTADGPSLEEALGGAFS